MGNFDLKELEISIYKEILNWKYSTFKVKTKKRRKGFYIGKVVLINTGNFCIAVLCAKRTQGKKQANAE